MSRRKDYLRIANGLLQEFLRNQRPGSHFLCDVGTSLEQHRDAVCEAEDSDARFEPLRVAAAKGEQQGLPHTRGL